MVTYLLVTLARVELLAHLVLRPACEKKFRSCDLGIKPQDEDSSEEGAKVPPAHSRDSLPTHPASPWRGLKGAGTPWVGVKGQERDGVWHNIPTQLQREPAPHPRESSHGRATSGRRNSWVCKKLE